MIHLWCEDSSESITVKVWSFLCKELGVEGIKFDIQGIGSNHALVNFLKSIERGNNFENDDIYLIFIDCDYDNLAVESLVRFAYDLEDRHNNIVVIDQICIEYTLLGFQELDSWVKPYWSGKLYDRYCTIKHVIDIFRRYVYEHKNWRESRIVVEYVIASGLLSKRLYRNKSMDERLEAISIENIAYLLLTDLINYRKEHFSVTKTYLGECWTCDCCHYEKEKFCNMLNDHISSVEKASKLFYGSDFSKQIHKASEKFKDRVIEI